MITRSLRGRFFAAVIVAIVLSLLVAGIGLNLIFDRALRARAAADLDDQARILAANLGFNSEGSLALVASLQDTRFLVEGGGLYWQAGSPDRIQLRSPSLGSRNLTWPSGPSDWLFDLLGPDGKRLIAIERRIGRHIEGSDRAIRILVAMDEDELYEARLTFLEWLVGSLSFLGVVLILGAWMFLAYAFLPFAELRRALTDLHTGSVRRIDGMFPDEVQPLVEDLNRVLANRDEDLQRAQSRAADLAHGLKTPLAVISATARDLRARGFELAANEVEEEVARMDRYVRLELTRARAGLLANQVGQSSPAASILRKIVRAIGQISESVVQIDLTADENIVVGIAEQDLMEIAGNLIENAAKWAKTRVIVSVKRAGEDILIIVEDDGTGLPDPIGVIDFQRGRRLDESKPGTGLGLAIVKDICDAYNCRLSFDRSTLGGLRATVYVAEMAT